MIKYKQESNYIQMKALFIFPPLWTTSSISTGIPQIMGHLEKNGYKDVDALDLNIKVFNFFYNDKNKLIKLLNYLKEEEKKLHFQLQTNDIMDIHDLKQKRKTFSFVSKLVTPKKQEKKILDAINKIEKIIKKHKNGKFDKTQNSLIKTNKTFLIINKLISTALIIKEKNTLNLLYNNLFNDVTDRIIEEKYDYIGFSINNEEQYLNSLYIAKILRAKGSKSHICFGGTETDNIKQTLKDNKVLFEKYIDTLMLGEGEHPTYDLFEYLEGKKDIKDISNIIYLDKYGEIKENEQKQVLEKGIITSSYKGFDFREYTTPEAVIPIRTSWGCYWGKCTFCDYNKRTKYEARSTDSVIEEIKHYIQRYKINNFYFVDAALSPAFLKEFAEKIEKENLEIYYFTNLRFEENYTKEFLKKLYKSGLRCCGWGLESASQKILNLMQKGTNINIIQKILKDSSEIGIYNHLYYIYGFPTETKEDFEMTYEFIKNNSSNISSIAKHDFILNKNSYIYSNLEKFNIDKNFINSLEEKKPYATFFGYKEINHKNFSTYYDKLNMDLEERIINKKINNTSFELLVLCGKYKNHNTFYSSLKNILHKKHKSSKK